MGFFEIRKADFFDDRGEYVGTKWFSKHKPTFEYKGKRYLNDLNNPSYSLGKGLIWNTRFYKYNIGNPKPRSMANKQDYSEIDAEQFNALFETKVLKDLNDINSNWLQKLSPTTMIIIIVVIGVAIYLFKGGKLV